MFKLELNDREFQVVRMAVAYMMATSLQDMDIIALQTLIKKFTELLRGVKL